MESKQEPDGPDCGSTSSFWDSSDALSLSHWPRPVQLSAQEIQEIYFRVRSSNASSRSLVDVHIGIIPLEANSDESAGSSTRHLKTIAGMI